YALRLCGALGAFWMTRGYWSEGAQWTERALERLRQTTSVDQQRLRARALHVIARLREHQAPESETRARYEESLQLRRAVGDSHAIAESLIAITMFCYLHGD